MNAVRGTTIFICVMVLITSADNLRLNSNQIEQVSSVLEDNGWRNLTVVGEKINAYSQFMSHLSERNILTTTMTFRSFVESDKIHEYEYFVILSNNFERPNVLESISRTTPRSSFVITTKQEVPAFDTRINLDLNFLITTFDEEDAMGLHHFINTPRFSSPVINRVRFHPGSYSIIEEFNLQGKTLLGDTMPFPPYITMNDCDESNNADSDVFVDFDPDGLRCSEVFGYHSDLVKSLAARNNFTFEIRLPSDRSWGLEPDPPTDFLNGTFYGALGMVVNRESDFGPSTWIWNIDRDKVLDFAPAMLDVSLLAVKPQSPKVDLNFFIRPFTAASWVCILTIAVLTLTIVVPPYLLLPSYEFNESHQIASTAGWVFFTLVNAYYGGAMTMFFTSEVELPFSDTREVMQSSSWKLKFLDGNSEYFASNARNGDEDFQNYYNKFIQDPDAYTFPDILTGLDELQSELMVMVINRGILTAAFMNNPSRLAGRRVETFGTMDNAWHNIVFPKRSPLTRLFRRGLSRMVQSGVTARLSVEWEGPGLPLHTSQPLEILTLGQTVVVFVVMGTALGLSAALLITECCFKRYNIRPKTCFRKSESRSNEGVLVLPAKFTVNQITVSRVPNLTPIIETK